LKEHISIIIPTFNRAFSLNNAIESVQAQTCENWELILIDDGSVDETPELVKKYLSDDRIKYFYQENMGVSVARNSGAKLASGDYLIFLDSDDIFFPDLIKNIYEAGFYKYDLICWQVLKNIDGKEKIWKPKQLDGMYNNIKATFLAGSICFKKSIFLQAGGYDPKMSFGENYEFGMRLCEQANLKINNINKPLLYYEIQTQNRSSNSIKNRLSSYIHQYKKHKEKYDKNIKSKAEMNYILGFVLEKSNRKTAALAQFKNSWMSNPWRLKPLLKIIYLKLFR
jgi:glycosyltransferase involved in cell wall biosynthesis